MDISFIEQVFEEHKDQDAIFSDNYTCSYDTLRQELNRCRLWLKDQRLGVGDIVTLEADFSHQSVALLLALMERDCLIVPITEGLQSHQEEFCDTAQVGYRISVGDTEISMTPTGVSADHALISELRERQHPGLILFSSGSTGKRKAVLHDMVNLTSKFRVRRITKRTLTFFLLDHIGGIDTLLHTLSNGGCIIIVPDRRPETICRIVEKSRAEVLPVSPTFINLLLLSGEHRKRDLSSLQIVTYGTEVMPKETLTRLCEAMPWVRTLQKYGLSEVGALRSKSESNDSCWVKLGGENIQLRVVDEMLEIQSPTTMMGYLNAESPFTEDGWFKTGDVVEVKGEYFRILGRKSEQINVGGEKFYPAEAEQILLEMPDVVDVMVKSEPNAISGSVVVATFKLSSDKAVKEHRAEMRAFCAERMPRFMVPQKVKLSSEDLHSERYKKKRQ